MWVAQSPWWIIHTNPRRSHRSRVCRVQESSAFSHTWTTFVPITGSVGPIKASRRWTLDKITLACGGVGNSASPPARKILGDRFAQPPAGLIL